MDWFDSLLYGGLNSIYRLGVILRIGDVFPCHFFQS